MLNIAVSGHTPTSMYAAARILSDLWHDQDFDNLREIPPLSRPPSSDSISSMATDKPKQPSPDRSKKAETDSVKLAARKVSSWANILARVFIYDPPFFLEQGMLYGARWLSGRVLDSRPRGCGLEPH